MANLSKLAKNLAKYSDEAVESLSKKAKKLPQAADELPMDEASRMARAKEMGFDTEKTYYHGTGNDIEEFNPELLGSNTTGPSRKLGIHFSESPDLANEYAKESAPIFLKKATKQADDAIEDATKKLKELKNKHGSDESLWPEDASRKKREAIADIIEKNDSLELARKKSEKLDWESGTNVIPVKLKMKNPAVIDLDGGFIDSKAHELAKKYKESGKYDGVIFKNAYDTPGPFRAGEKRAGATNVAVVFEPNQVRSKFAAFDPSKAKSGKLVAGLGAAAIGSSLLSNEAEASDNMNSKSKLIKEAEDKWNREQLIKEAEAKWLQDNSSDNLGEQVETGARSLAEGFTLGASEPLISGATALGQSVMAAQSPDVDFSTELLKQKYEEDVARRRALEEKYPMSAAAGEIAGAFVPGPGLVAKGVGLVGKGAKALIPALKGVEAAAEAGGVLGGAAKIAKGGAKAATDVALSEGTKRAIEIPTGFIQPQDELTPMGENLETAAAMGAGMSAIPVVGKAAGAGLKAAGAKAANVLTGVTRKEIETYLDVAPKFKNASNIDDVREEINKIQTDLSSVLSDARLSKQEAQRVRDIAKQELDKAAKALRDNQAIKKADIKDAFNQAKNDLDQAFKIKYEPIKNVKAPTRLADEVLDAQEELKRKVSQGSSQAFDLLKKSNASVPSKDIVSRIKEIQDSLLVEGKLIDQPSKAAFQRLEDLKSDISGIKGNIKPESAKRIVQSIDKETVYNPAVGAFDETKNNALKQVRRFIDQNLKTKSPEYAAKMDEVASDLDLLDQAVKSAGTREKAIGRLSNIESERNADVRELLKKVGSATGRNLSAPIDEYMSAVSKQTPEFQESLKKSLPEYSQYRRAEMQQLAAQRPEFNKMAFQSFERSPVARQAAGAEKLLESASEQVQRQQNVLNLARASFNPRNKEIAPFISQLTQLGEDDLAQTINYLRASMPFERTNKQGSANTLFWGIMGMMSGGGLAGAGVGAAIGKYLDTYGPKTVKQILNGVISIQGMPTIRKIDKFMSDIPPQAREELKQDLIRAVGMNQDEGIVVIPESDRMALSEDIKASKFSNIQKAKMMNSLNKDGAVKQNELSKLAVEGYTPEKKPRINEALGL